MCFPTSRQSVNTAFRFTCKTRFQSSSGKEAAGWRDWIPAQFRRMWMLWLSARILGTRDVTEAWEERSQVYIVHFRPRDSIWDFVCVLVVSR